MNYVAKSVVNSICECREAMSHASRFAKGSTFCFVRQRRQRRHCRTKQTKQTWRRPPTFAHSANVTQVARVDFHRLDARGIRRTPPGGIRADARLTVGVFYYLNPDGAVRRELRHPDEVFHADSLATLEHAPVTNLHPPGLVTPATFQRDSVGHVSPGVRRDGAYVAAEVVVQDAATVAGVRSGDLREVSCGYVCDLDPSPGEFEGERYDAVQRNIRYNHAALGPENWGRAGSDVALRLDGRDAAVQLRTDAPRPAPKTEIRMRTIRIDGVDYEIGSDAHLQAQTRRDERLIDEMAAANARADELMGRVDGLTAQVAELTERAERAEVAAAEATSPERLDALANERAELIERARRVLGVDFRADGQSTREVHAAVIRARRADANLDDASDDYLRGLFEAMTGETRHDGGSPVAHRVVVTTTTPAPDTTDPEQARRDMLQDSREGWKQPLAVNKAALLGL